MKKTKTKTEVMAEAMAVVLKATEEKKKGKRDT